MEVETEREMIDFAAVESPSEAVINMQSEEVESPEEVVNHQEKGKSSKWCCGLIRTPWQCAPVSTACFGLTVVLLSGTALIANNSFDQNGDNQGEQNVDTIANIGNMGLGVLTFLVSGVIFFVVRHYKPKKDFEGLVGDLKSENKGFKTENQSLKENAKELQRILENYRDLLKEKKELTEETRAMLEEKILGLENNRKNLELVVQDYENKVSNDIKEISAEAKQAKEINKEVADSNKELKETLGNLDCSINELEENKKKLESSLNMLSKENENIAKYKLGVQNLGEFLTAQLEMIRAVIKTLQSLKEEMKLQVNRLDDTDDKLRDASNKLEELVKEKEGITKELEDANISLEEHKQARKNFRETILKLREIDSKSIEDFPGFFDSILKTLDEGLKPSNNSEILLSIDA